MLDADPSIEFVPPARPAGRRFRRHADAITQAEIRRLLSFRAPAPPDPGVQTVQEELRRLSSGRARPAPRRRQG